MATRLAGISMFPVKAKNQFIRVERRHTFVVELIPDFGIDWNHQCHSRTLVLATVQ